VVSKSKPLTGKERAFSHLYVQHHNGTQAAREAGYKDGPGLKVTASRLLTKANVAAYVAELEAKALAKVDSKRDQVLAELHHLGLARVTRTLGPDGKPLPVSEWPEAERAALTQLEVRETLGKPDEKGAQAVVERRVKARFDQKLGALNTLAEHHKLVKRTSEEGTFVFRLEDLIVASRRRLELEDRQSKGGAA